MICEECDGVGCIECDFENMDYDSAERRIKELKTRQEELEDAINEYDSIQEEINDIEDKFFWS
jgi:uncharacterized protein YPO0396